MPQRPSEPPYSALYALFRDSQVVNRESFTIATVDPETGARTGSVRGEEFAHQILEMLDLCGVQDGTCPREPCIERFQAHQADDGDDW
ncbi:hypothetical protein [Kitasatospora phosalacinea]|uniref:Uncharacterized protein n=1 Tax=Kitasatospora phosalacinea TaxID=2065 RepID=A0A9W6PNB0_9ACTN|nr:hypothetical protein [Kitasatospora phosalacinea]GLW58142.1 hypothetical protein Kpho01_61530 [Kitasatospora phosalacinea]